MIFIAEGDMRQAVNNLQSTYVGFRLVSPSHVYKVCDQPHPVALREIVNFCNQGKLDDALQTLNQVIDQGFAPVDIISTLYLYLIRFKVTKSAEIAEYTKLEFIKEIGYTHMRLLEGCQTPLQLSALLAKMTKINLKP